MSPNERKMKTTPILTPWLVLLWMALMPGLVQAQTIELNKLALDNLGDSLQLYFGFAPKEFAEFQELLEDGVPLKLSCKAFVWRSFAFWPDKLVSQEEVHFELTTNALTKEYVFTDLQRNQASKNKKLESLLRANLEELSLNLGDWESLVRGQEYALELEVCLKRNDVPNWLLATLFFWRGDILKDKKYTMRFTY